MSEREEVIYAEFNAYPHPSNEHHAMAEEIATIRLQLTAAQAAHATLSHRYTHDMAELRAQLTTAERERDEARRERDVLKKVVDDTYTDERGTTWGIPTAFAYARACLALDKLRHRAERAERVVEYIRRAFRGAIESDALAATYKTVGSYRAGLLKTINALDTTDAP